MCLQGVGWTDGSVGLSCAVLGRSKACICDLHFSFGRHANHVASLTHKPHSCAGQGTGAAWGLSHHHASHSLQPRHLHVNPLTTSPAVLLDAVPYCVQGPVLGGRGQLRCQTLQVKGCYLQNVSSQPLCSQTTGLARAPFSPSTHSFQK